MLQKLDTLPPDFNCRKLPRRDDLKDQRPLVSRPVESSGMQQGSDRL
jgi:hypothetical protein